MIYFRFALIYILFCSCNQKQNCKSQLEESGSLIAASFSFEKIKSMFDEKAKNILDQLGQPISKYSNASIRLTHDEDRCETYDDITFFEIYIEDIL